MYVLSEGSDLCSVDRIKILVSAVQCHLGGHIAGSGHGTVHVSPKMSNRSSTAKIVRLALALSVAFQPFLVE
jgi:hypothetical protein